MKTTVKTAVIPVAGLGTRGLPFTKEVPKEYLPILDTPAIHFIVEECLASGIERIIFVTSREKKVIEDYFDLSPQLEDWLVRRGKPEIAERIRRIGEKAEILSLRQKAPLGLGHAVLCARPAVGDEPFAVCLGDEVFPDWEDAGRPSGLSALIEAASRLRASVVGTMEIPREESRFYGMIDFGGEVTGFPARVLRTVEKPAPEAAPSRYGIVGRYVFEPGIFDCLKQVRAGVGGEIQLTDGMDRLGQAGKLYALKLEGSHYDVGNPFSYVKAQLDAALRRPELAERLRLYLRSL